MTGYVPVYEPQPENYCVNRVTVWKPWKRQKTATNSISGVVWGRV